MTIKRHLVLALAAWLGGCAQPPGPERVVEPRPFAAPAPRGEALLQQAMVDGHGAVRGAAGLPRLAWDPALVASARTYARAMARTGRFEHAAQPPGGPLRQGENLWTGTRGAYAYAEMIGH